MTPFLSGFADELIKVGYDWNKQKRDKAWQSAQAGAKPVYQATKHTKATQADEGARGSLARGARAGINAVSSTAGAFPGVKRPVPVLPGPKPVPQSGQVAQNKNDRLTSSTNTTSAGRGQTGQGKPARPAPPKPDAGVKNLAQAARM